MTMRAAPALLRSERATGSRLRKGPRFLGRGFSCDSERVIVTTPNHGHHVTEGDEPCGRLPDPGATNSNALIKYVTELADKIIGPGLDSDIVAPVFPNLEQPRKRNGCKSGLLITTLLTFVYRDNGVEQKDSFAATC